MLWTLRLENLQKAMDVLDHQNCECIGLRYARGLTLEEMGKFCGVSKMAVLLDGSWRLCLLEPSRPPCEESVLKKLHEKLMGSVIWQGPSVSFAFCSTNAR